MFSELFGHKCKVCGKKAKDVLNQSDNTSWFCREHIIDLFTKEFLAYKDRMLLFHPEFNKGYKAFYAYYPLAEMGNFGFKKEVVLNMEKLLDHITGHCEQCRNKAQVLYFPKGLLDYSGRNTHIERVHHRSGELLCINHAIEKIKTDLESNPGFYSEGLYTPYTKDGMYFLNY